jgi:putative membrane protein
MAVLLAQMYDGGRGDHMDGDWWWVMGLGFLILLAALVGVVVVVLSRRSGPSTSASGGRSAEDVLADRFARGEIDAEEYRRRRDVIRE